MPSNVQWIHLKHQPYGRLESKVNQHHRTLGKVRVASPLTICCLVSSMLRPSLNSELTPRALPPRLLSLPKASSHQAMGLS